MEWGDAWPQNPCLNAKMNSMLLKECEDTYANQIAQLIS